MNVQLLLGVRMDPLEKLNVIRLEHVNITEQALVLRKQVSEQTNLPKDTFDLIYCGVVLDDETPLDAYGIKHGSLLHFLKRKEEDEKATSKETNSSDSAPNIQMLISVFQSFIGIPLLQLAMRHMTKRPEVISNIIASSPGLSHDAVAIAILHDPDLLVHFTNAETLKKIAKLHPALLDAAQHIASAVHDEAHNFAVAANAITNSVSAPSTGQSYGLDNLSDDEEMAGDSSQSSDSPQPSNSTNQTRYQAESDTVITAARFIAALREARRTTPNNGASTTTSSSSVSRSNSNSGQNFITFEMFSEAMQQAFASTPVTNNGSSNSQSQTPSASFTPPNSSSGNHEMERQITIMHEMGLLNDAMNLQALQITNGDVQAAIELVLSDFGNN